MRLRGLWMLVVGAGLVLSLGGRGHADEPMRERLAAQGLVTANRYSWKRISQRVMSYYERLLEAKGESPTPRPRRGMFQRIDSGSSVTTTDIFERIIRKTLEQKMKRPISSLNMPVAD